MSETQTNMNNTEESKTIPKNIFRDGNISVTQWDNTLKNSSGEEFVVSNYVIRRGYKPKDSDEWVSTDQLTKSDLLKVSELLKKAYSVE